MKAEIKREKKEKTERRYRKKMARKS